MDLGKSGTSPACHHVQHRELGKTYVKDKPGRDASDSEITEQGPFQLCTGLQFGVNVSTCILIAPTLSLNKAFMTLALP